VAVIAAVVAIGYRMWLFLGRVPATLGRIRRDGRRRRGYVALTRGLVAVAAGDAQGARRQMHRAENLLGDPALTLLLTAQTAQLSGDEEGANRSFRAMLERPETEFLGLRGLFNQAMRRGDRDAALDVAARARRLKPGSEWVSDALFELECGAGQWADAEATVKTAVRRNLIEPEEGRRRRAILQHLRSIQESSLAEEGAALRLAHKAHQADLAFIPAAVRLAGLLLAKGRRRKAAAVVEETWARAPHPDLVAPYVEAREAQEPLARVRAVERLAALNPGHGESRLAVAEAPSRP
jgi:HemY protein